MRKKNKIGVIRLITLVCFFHFSGLNNGFSCLVKVSSQCPAQFVKISFVPAVVQKISQTVRQSSRMQLFSGGRWAHPFNRSGKFLEIVSQNALQGMLLKSTAFQMWVNQALKTAKPFHITPDVAAGNYQPPSANSFPSQSLLGGAQDSYLDKLENYLSFGRKEQWLGHDRFRYGNDDRRGFAGSTAFCSDQNFRWRDYGVIRLRRASVIIMRSCSPPLLLFSSSDDDSEAALTGSAAESNKL